MDTAKLREKLGYTQQQLALLLGIHYMTVSSWERGKGEPLPHQIALMGAFDLAVERDADVTKRAITMATTQGFAPALYCLLEAAYGNRST